MEISSIVVLVEVAEAAAGIGEAGRGGPERDHLRHAAVREDELGLVGVELPVAVAVEEVEELAHLLLPFGGDAHAGDLHAHAHAHRPGLGQEKHFLHAGDGDLVVVEAEGNGHALDAGDADVHAAGFGARAGEARAVALQSFDGGAGTHSA